MSKHWTVLVTASLATLLALFAPAPLARADIFEWEYINPANPGEGKQQSTMLAPDGAGANTVPFADLSFRNLTMAYLIRADLSSASATLTDLTNAELSQANLTNARFSAATLTGANLTGAEVRGASFYYSLLSAAQLYSTASYQAHDLSGIYLHGNYADLNLAGQNLPNANLIGATLTNADLSQANLTNAHFTAAGWVSAANLTGANLSQANLTNASFGGFEYCDEWNCGFFSPAANLNGAILSGADARGANFDYVDNLGANISNLIWTNGHIYGLDLTDGASQVVRDYDGNPAAPVTGPLPIVVEQHLAMGATGTLRLVFDADPWDSTISFAPGIPVARGGTLDLTFAPGVNVATQSGRTIDLFDWTGVAPTGAFTVISPYTWDVTNLYTTGEITLDAVTLLPGDYNQNGIVDAADYTVWRDRFGSGTALANDDTPGVGPDDYDRWKLHFGEVAGGNGPGSGAALPSAAPLSPAVPEPTTFALVMIVGTVVLCAKQVAVDRHVRMANCEKQSLKLRLESCSQS